MATHDEKQFLELLQAYKSEDTKKARRNLSTVAFVVIAAWILGVKLTNVRVFGVDLSSTSEFYLYCLALGLLLYWAAMLYLSLAHDAEIQKERSIQFDKAVASLLARNKQLQEMNKGNANNGYIHPDTHELKSAVEAYERQKERTSKAARFGRLISLTELYVPIALFFGAASILISGAVYAH